MTVEHILFVVYRLSNCKRQVLQCSFS